MFFFPERLLAVGVVWLFEVAVSFLQAHPNCATAADDVEREVQGSGHFWPVVLLRAGALRNCSSHTVYDTR